MIAVGRDVALAPRFAEPRDAGRWLAVDLLASGALDALLEATAPAVIVHCAALSRVGACEQEPSLAERLNAGLPAELARHAARAGARLVHVSTDLVFGARDAPASGFREDALPEPVSVYGETKLHAERAVLEAHPAACVVRLPLLYGNSGGRGLGASDSLLEAVHADRRPPLFVDEWRTPLEVTAAAAALVELAEDLECQGVLHVAGPDRVSRHELGLSVLDAMGLPREEAEVAIEPARQAEVETQGARPRDVSLDAGRARGLLETDLPGVRSGTQRATS